MPVDAAREKTMDPIVGILEESHDIPRSIEPNGEGSVGFSRRVEGDDRATVREHEGMSITVRSAIDSGNVPGRIDDSSGGSLLRTEPAPLTLMGVKAELLLCAAAVAEASPNADATASPASTTIRELNDCGSP